MVVAPVVETTTGKGRGPLNLSIHSSDRTMTEIHRNILRGLLIALGVTAAAGVMSVLMQNNVMARVTGTGFVAVLAALIMLKISISLDNEKLRNSAIFGLVVVVIEFLILLALIWSDTFGLMDELKLWMTALLFMFWSTVTALAIKALPIALSRLAGRVGLGFAAVTLVTLMISIWGPRPSNEDWGATTGLLTLMGIAISCCCVGIHAPAEARLPARPWRWVGILGGAVAVAVGLIAIWNDRNFFFDRSLGKAASIAALTAIYIGFANIAVLTPLKSNQRWLLHATLATGLVLCALVALLVFEIADDDILRFIAATAIPTACGIIALSAVARLNKRVEFDMSAQDYLFIHLTCPRCRALQQLKPGKSNCDRCGLKFEIKVEEPKCPSCDYLLYMLDADRCPECGTAITTKVQQGIANPSASAPPPPPIS